jgi:flagellar motor switch protein FliG
MQGKTKTRTRLASGPLAISARFESHWFLAMHLHSNNSKTFATPIENSNASITSFALAFPNGFELQPSLKSFFNPPPTSNDGKSLMEASTEHRIRLLAIAIDGMDSVDAALLLECLPESISTRVGQLLKDLGEISQHERRLAIETIEGLMASVPESEPHWATENPNRSAFTAAELNSRELPQESATPNADRLAPSGSVPRSILLESQPIEVVASVLSEQRPIIIATVLRHVPSRLGQSIVQRLEIGLAKAALEWIPKLSPTPELVLDEVLSGIESQVRQLRSANESRDQGDEKMRELLSVLKVSEEAPTLNFEELNGATSTPSISGIPQAYLPPSTTGPVSTDPATAFVIPLHRKTDREELLAQLLGLDDLDLLRVLYSHSVDDVKRFLAGANKAMRLRIEKLTPPNALKRLRRELAAVPIVEEKTWREIAGRMEQTAQELQPEPSLRIPA